ncbi:MAG: hypothetical protein ACI4VL_02285 [Bacilli bacterium]
MMKRQKYNPVLTEEDFYPPTDNRTFHSLVYDVNGGDNFVEYIEYIFDIYDNEDMYED